MQDEEIICIALLKVKVLDSITPEELRALRGVFNLAQKSSFVEGLIEFKKTLSFLILIERDNTGDYLALPKFRALPTQLYQKLASYCNELWKVFCAQKMAISLHSLKTYQQVQTPMQKLSSSITHLKINQKRQIGPPGSFDRFSSYFSPYGGGSDDSGVLFHNQPMPPYVYPYQNYMGGNLFPNFNMRSREPEMYDNIMVPSRHPQEQLRPTNQPSVQKNSRGSSDSLNAQIVQKKEEISEKEMESQDIILSLNGCFCGEDPDQALVKCSMCQKKYHFKCWQFQYQADAVCPFCRVVKMHNYTKIVKDPVFQRCSLTDHSFFRSKRINLTEDERKKLASVISAMEADDKNWTQLRVLKIGKDHPEEKKGFKSCFSIPLTELKKMQDRHWLELKFKSLVEGDCIIFALVCITPKGISECQSQIMSRSQQNNHYVQEWLKAKGMQVFKIRAIHPVTGQRIMLPVRGSRCDHLECEDFTFVYEQGAKKDCKILCSFCKKEYSVYESFELDPFVWQILKNSNQSEVELKLSDNESHQEKGQFSMQEQNQK